MKVSIIGLGWYGHPLAIALKNSGIEVQGTTRSLEKKKKLETDGLKVSIFDFPSMPSEQLLKVDILILNIPPFENQLKWIQTWKFTEKPWIIFISSTSERPILLEQEAWIKSLFPNWTVLRFAGLLGGDRHPGKFLSGKKNLSGRLWPVNLLHLDDAVGFTLAIIDKKITHQTINVVSDEHGTREEFYTEYAKDMGLALPEFDPKDSSTKTAVDNQQAKNIYQFSWPKIR